MRTNLDRNAQNCCLCFVLGMLLFFFFFLFVSLFFCHIVIVWTSENGQRTAVFFLTSCSPHTHLGTDKVLTKWTLTANRERRLRGETPLIKSQVKVWPTTWHVGLNVHSNLFFFQRYSGSMPDYDRYLGVQREGWGWRGKWGLKNLRWSKSFDRAFLFFRGGGLQSGPAPFRMCNVGRVLAQIVGSGTG